uniref:Rhodanese domain protein n=1 Tax=Chlorobium phaeovibrioides (strain DSM 265 / 1930) TaxID=290318 RepID=A4SDP0_CHLPM
MYYPPTPLNKQVYDYMTKVKDIDPTAAFAMTKKGALLIDVREAREVKRTAFDVDEVMLMPMSRFSGMMKEIPTNRKVILACHTGSRSIMATRMLEKHGHKRVLNMQYGIAKWERTGLPVKKAPKQPPFAWLKKLFGKQS